MSNKTSRNKRKGSNRTNRTSGKGKLKRTTPHQRGYFRLLTESEKYLAHSATLLLEEEGIHLPNIQPLVCGIESCSDEEVWVIFPGEISAYPEKRFLVVRFQDCIILLGYNPAVGTTVGSMGTLFVARVMPSDTPHERIEAVFKEDWNLLDA